MTSGLAVACRRVAGAAGFNYQVVDQSLPLLLGNSRVVNASARALSEKNSTGARRRSAYANISASSRHLSSPTMAILSIDFPCFT